MKKIIAVLVLAVAVVFGAFADNGIWRVSNPADLDLEKVASTAFLGTVVDLKLPSEDLTDSNNGGYSEVMVNLAKDDPEKKDWFTNVKVEEQKYKKLRQLFKTVLGQHYPKYYSPIEKHPTFVGVAINYKDGFAVSAQVDVLDTVNKAAKKFPFDPAN
jgi:hypothetical protein